MEKSNLEELAETLYDYPSRGVNSSLHRSGDGSTGEGCPRAWDGVSRPVLLEIYRHYGFPHYWPSLREADNPFLAEIESVTGERKLSWVSEYDDEERKGRTWYGGEYDRWNDAFKAAKQKYEELFDDGKHHLVYSESVKHYMPNFVFHGRREGD